MKPDVKNIQARIALGGDVGKVLALIRNDLADGKMISASISKTEARQGGGRYWRYDYDNHISMGVVTASQRKSADMALARVCDQLSPSEIGAVEALNTALSDYLRGKTAEVPSFRMGSGLDLDALIEGPAPELMKAVGSIGHREEIASIALAGTYMTGTPRAPYVRWLPRIVEGSTKNATDELTQFSEHMEEGALVSLNECIAAAGLFFRRRLQHRRTTISRLAQSSMGERAQEWLAEKRFATAPTRLEELTRDYEFERAVARFAQGGRPSARRGRFGENLNEPKSRRG